MPRNALSLHAYGLLIVPGIIMNTWTFINVAPSISDKKTGKVKKNKRTLTEDKWFEAKLKY